LEEITIDNYTKLVKHRVCGDIDKIIVEYLEKSSNETVVDSSGQIIHDQTLTIETIYVDDIQLDSSIVAQSARYYPCYRKDFIEYCQNNNIDLLVGPQQAMKFWHSGEWKFIFERDFWAWYYQQRVIGNESNNYVGQSSDQIKSKLAELKQLL
jgi:hypothetical protein